MFLPLSLAFPSSRLTSLYVEAREKSKREEWNGLKCRAGLSSSYKDRHRAAGLTAPACAVTKCCSPAKERMALVTYCSDIGQDFVGDIVCARYERRHASANLERFVRHEHKNEMFLSERAHSGTLTSAFEEKKKKTVCLFKGR